MKQHENFKGRDGTPCRPGCRNPEKNGRRRRGVPTLMMAVMFAMAFTVGCGKKKAEHFGEPFTDAPEVAIARLLESPDSFRRQSVRVQGEIERQCPAAGCWLFLNDGEGRSIRVELGDYFPELPRHVGGIAAVEGEWIPMGAGHQFIGTRITFREGKAP